MLPAQQVIERLKALNRLTVSWGVIDGRSEGVDLIAEWKIVDAPWYEIYAQGRPVQGIQTLSAAGRSDDAV